MPISKFILYIQNHQLFSGQNKKNKNSFRSIFFFTISCTTPIKLNTICQPTVPSDEKLLVSGQVVLLLPLHPAVPLPSGAGVDEMVPGNDKLLGGQHARLPELGLL